MSYSIDRTVAGGFDEIIARVKEALKTEGFGVLTEIDVAATLKSKLGADFRPYRILGACNPPLAKQALETEARIGVMLPCNVVIQAKGANEVEVSAINPAAPMSVVGNPALQKIAQEVETKLRRVIERF